MNAERSTPHTPEPALDRDAESAPAQRQPGLPKRLIQSGADHAADLVARTESSLPVRCLRWWVSYPLIGEGEALRLGPSVPTANRLAAC